MDNHPLNADAFDALTPEEQAKVRHYVQLVHAAPAGSDVEDMWCDIVAEDDAVMSKIISGKEVLEGLGSMFWKLSSSDREAVMFMATQETSKAPDHGGINKDNSTFTNTLIETCNRIISNPVEFRAAKESLASFLQHGGP